MGIIKTLATQLTYARGRGRGRILTRARLARHSFDGVPRFRPVFVTDQEFDSWCMDSLKESFRGCQRCPLGKGATPVFGDGPIDPTLLVVGGAPSEMDEELDGTFRDHDGILLRRAFKKLGLSLKSTAFLTSTVLCFPGDTKVQVAGRIEKRYRRWYECELVRVRTRTHELSGTPNHPVMTRRGWVSLDSLSDADHLICTRLGERMCLSDPHVNYAPALIQKVFSAGEELSARIRHWVGGCDMDFHGDGMNAEIQVISQNSLLGDWTDPAIFQHSLQCVLKGSDLAFGPLLCGSYGYCYSMDFPRRSLSSSTHGIGGLGKLPPALQPESPMANSHGFRFVPEVNTLGLECFSDPAISDPVLVGERLEAFAGQVSFDQVIQVERQSFVGHVYNLQTSNGWYVANGIIVSNCRPPRSRKPKAEERGACMQRLEHQASNLKPWVILLLGREAAHWLGYRTVEDHRGLVPKDDWPSLGPEGRRNLKAIFLTEHPKTVMGAKQDRSRAFKAWIRDLKKVAVVCQRIKEIREANDERG